MNTNFYSLWLTRPGIEPESTASVADALSTRPLIGLGAGLPAAGGFGSLAAKPPAVKRFLVIFWKKSYFNAIGSHFARVQSHLKALDFWHLKAN